MGDNVYNLTHKIDRWVDFLPSFFSSFLSDEKFWRILISLIILLVLIGFVRFLIGLVSDMAEGDEKEERHKCYTKKKNIRTSSVSMKEQKTEDKRLPFTVVDLKDFRKRKKP